MSFAFKRTAFTKSLLVSLLCLACIQPMVSLATPTQEETATFNALKAKAESGDVQAQEKLGETYEYGRGIIKDEKLAIKWYEKATLQGCNSTKLNLIHLYFMSDNYHKSFSLAKQFEQTDDLIGITWLASHYKWGLGTEKDTTKALALYLKASIKGHYMGSYYMGRMYEKGIGVTKNKIMAFHYYEKYANQGYPESQEEVASLYFKEGGFNNFISGCYWFLYAQLEKAREPIDWTMKTSHYHRHDYMRTHC